MSMKNTDVAKGMPRATEKVGAAMAHLTKKLSPANMHKRVVEALGPEKVRDHGPFNEKPFELDLQSPLPQRVRLYLFNATRPPGGRPLGEHKVQLILPGQSRGVRGNFDHSDGRIVLLAGYSAEEDVFVFWDACAFSLFIRRIPRRFKAVRIRRITLLPATRTYDEGHRRRAVQQSGPSNIGGAWLADPLADLSGECGLGLRCNNRHTRAVGDGGASHSGRSRDPSSLDSAASVNCEGGEADGDHLEAE